MLSAGRNTDEVCPRNVTYRVAWNVWDLVAIRRLLTESVWPFPQSVLMRHTLRTVYIGFRAGFA